jgi:hypothetical protein
MAQDFRSVMSELWTKLKLGAPDFGPTHALTLSIDGFDIGLNESADGRNVVVSGVIGRLAADAYRREEQVRKLLKSNLGMLQSSGAGLSLETTDETATVRVQAIYPYAANRLDLLTRGIEEVLFRLEMHAGDLTVARGRGPARESAVAPASLETFIIRP